VFGGLFQDIRSIRNFKTVSKNHTVTVE